jgi:hypothetical protein
MALIHEFDVREDLAYMHGAPARMPLRLCNALEMTRNFDESAWAEVQLWSVSPIDEIRRVNPGHSESSWA